MPVASSKPPTAFPSRIFLLWAGLMVAILPPVCARFLPGLDALMPAILATIPVGLLLCLAGMFMSGRKAAVPAVENEVENQVRAALRDLREGHAARTRCPRCRAVILLTAGRAPDGAPRVNSACACGACDDSLELAGKAA